jgi:hypothetical protein
MLPSGAEAPSALWIGIAPNAAHATPNADARIGNEATQSIV